MISDDGRERLRAAGRKGGLKRTENTKNKGFGSNPELAQEIAKRKRGARKRKYE